MFLILVSIAMCINVGGVEQIFFKESNNIKGTGTGGAVYRHWWRSVPALVAQCVKGLLPR
jgi:hypothetical protein